METISWSKCQFNLGILNGDARREAQSSGKLNSPKFQNQKNLSLVVACAHRPFPFPDKPNQANFPSDPIHNLNLNPSARLETHLHLS
jgi:hypothetical protein